MLGAALRASVTVFKSPMTWLRHPRRLRTILAWMTAALVVPALVFSSYLVARSAQQQRMQVEQQLAQVATDLAGDLDREFERLLTLLDTLSLSTRLHQGDFAGFHATATRAMQRIGAHVLVLDPSFHQVLNTRVPYGTPLPMTSDLQSAQAVRASNAPVVSNLFIGQVSKGPIFDVLVPLTEQVADHILIMTLDAEHLRKFIMAPQLPTGWVIGVTDRDGRIMARSLEHDTFVGKFLPQALIDASRQGLLTGSAFTTLNVKGVPTMRAVSRSQKSGWLTSANVPLSLIEAEIRRGQMFLTLAALGLLALAGALASLFSKLIVGPINALTASAVTLEADEVPLPLTSPIAEANHVAAALRAASLELKSRTSRLRASERRLDLAQRTARLAYVDFDLTRNKLVISETFEDVLGFQLPTEDLEKANRIFVTHIHPDDRRDFIAAQRKASDEIGPFRNKFRVIRPDGTVRWFSAHGETSADAAGGPARMLVTNLDITQEAEQDEHIKFLLREMSHRSKNLLAVIQAMATQTGRTSPDYQEFQLRFTRRLQGMAASHDLLVHQNWQGVDVASLLRAQVRPFAGEHHGRFELGGPAVVLKPEAAQSLGLAIHELATNAMKYGALSVPSGKVSIDWWTPSHDTAAARFKLTWAESGGPLVATPDRKGFGHTVFDRMIKQALNASVELHYRPNGLVWSLDAALDQVIDTLSRP
jgi:PAS domain S-box-containing protein